MGTLRQSVRPRVAQVPKLPTIHVPGLADFKHGGSWDDFSWDPKSTNGQVTDFSEKDDGKMWVQRNQGWTGVSAKTPVCTADEKGKHHWFIQIRKGTYHQIGISQ